jgi:hypothetical protein
MAVLLWCMSCGQELVITGDVPVVCVLCKQVTTWCTAPPYHVTEMDARFLKSIHISHGKTD